MQSNLRNSFTKILASRGISFTRWFKKTKTKTFGHGYVVRFECLSPTLSSNQWIWWFNFEIEHQATYFISWWFELLVFSLDWTLSDWIYWGSPHGTLDPHWVRPLDPDSKTTLPPHCLDPDPSCVLCLCDNAWDPVKQCNAHSLRTVWSSRVTTLNPYRGSGSSESVFSACVKSPTDQLVCSHNLEKPN